MGSHLRVPESDGSQMLSFLNQSKLTKTYLTQLHQFLEMESHLRVSESHVFPLFQYHLDKLCLTTVDKLLEYFQLFWSYYTLSCSPEPNLSIIFIIFQKFVSLYFLLLTKSEVNNNNSACATLMVKSKRDEI